MSEYLIVSLACLFLADCITTHQILKNGGKELNGPLAKLMAFWGVDEALGVTKIVILAFTAASYVNDILGEYETWILASLNVFYVGVIVNNLWQWRKGERP